MCLSSIANLILNWNKFTSLRWNYDDEDVIKHKNKSKKEQKRTISMDKCQKTNNKILRLCMVIRFSRKTVTVAGAFAMQLRGKNAQVHKHTHSSIHSFHSFQNRQINMKIISVCDPLNLCLMNLWLFWLNGCIILNRWLNLNCWWIERKSNRNGFMKIQRQYNYLRANPKTKAQLKRLHRIETWVGDAEGKYHILMWLILVWYKCNLHQNTSF